jgi:3-oxoacyl-[acyl-carrier-protein] synthase II
MKRIGVSGLGAISSIGISASDFFRNLCDGKTGINKISMFDTSKYKRELGAEVKDITHSNKSSRALEFAKIACNEALQDSGFFKLKKPVRKLSLLVGTMFGGLDFYENMIFRNKTDDPVIKQKAFLYSQLNTIGNLIATDFKLQCDSSTISNTCATGTHVIGLAQHLILSGHADMVICCGVEAMTEFNFASFLPFRVMAKSKIAPFDKNREGTIAGEGAGCIILENIEHATKRGAQVYCELAGYGKSCDAFDMVGMDNQATGLTNAINETLINAGMKPQELDYINAHGTGTKSNDKLETLAIKNVFKESAYKIPISSSKSMIGHCLGAAGVLEAIVCILSIQNHIIPPTINYSTFDSECDLNYTPNHSDKKEIKSAMSNSFGFGGNNSCVIFRSLNHNP